MALIEHCPKVQRTPSEEVPSERIEYFSSPIDPFKTNGNPKIHSNNAEL